MNDSYSILIIEDEKNILDFMSRTLKANGYKTTTVTSGKAGLSIINSQCPDLILLDLGLPDMDGNDIIASVREWTSCPIIVISARTGEHDKVAALDLGADDYITKPFQSMELVARVRSHLRRYEQILNLKNETKNEDEYMIGDLVLNNTTKRVTLNSRDIKLTPKEFDILKLLISHPGQVFSSQQIYELVWKEEAINTETIMVHIRKLREKIEANPKKPIYIKVVWGQGYKMENIQ